LQRLNPHIFYTRSLTNSHIYASDLGPTRGKTHLVLENREFMLDPRYDFDIDNFSDDQSKNIMMENISDRDGEDMSPQDNKCEYDTDFQKRIEFWHSRIANKHSNPLQNGLSKLQATLRVLLTRIFTFVEIKEMIRNYYKNQRIHLELMKTLLFRKIKKQEALNILVDIAIKELFPHN